MDFGYGGDKLPNFCRTGTIELCHEIPLLFVISIPYDTWKEYNQTLISWNRVLARGTGARWSYLPLCCKITLFIPTTLNNGQEIFSSYKATSRSYQNLVLGTSLCILFKERLSLTKVRWWWQLFISILPSYINSPES